MKIYHTNFPIYILIILIAITIGFMYIFFSLKKEKKYNNMLLYFFLCFILIFTFGKIFTIIFIEHDIIKSSLSSFGGAIGMFMATIIFEMIMPFKGRLIKYTCLSLPLIYSISKIACFIVGCCYGIPYDGIFSVTYVDGLNIPLFPIQLLETIMFLLIFIVSNFFKSKKYIAYYSLIASIIIKFILDFLRYEHIKKVITFNQIVCIILFIITIIMIIVNKKISNKRNVSIN